MNAFPNFSLVIDYKLNESWKVEPYWKESGKLKEGECILGWLTVYGCMMAEISLNIFLTQ